MGLQGSLGGRGDSSIKAFLAVDTLYSLFFAALLGDTGVFCSVIDFGDSKGEGSSLDLDLEEAVVEDLF